MTVEQIRFRLALVVMALNAALLAALIVLAWQGKNISGENILFMASGVVLGWGGMVLAFYYQTSQSSVDKTALLENRPTGQPNDPVFVEEEHAR